jgi:glycosyltransferase involved in cell wall biosynthesis
MVSIILPTWKESRYLRDAIESCLSQSYEQLELILVDDGCTRPARETLETVAQSDRRVRIVGDGENRGLPKALNTGFAVARGEYFTWTSDDNRYRPNAIESLLEALEARPGLDIVYADMTVIDASDRIVRRAPVADYRELLADDCIHACFLYRRKVHEILGGFAEDLFLAEDYDFWLRASVQFSMMPVHRDLYEYREHPDSLTVSRKEQQQRAAHTCLERNLPHLAWASAEARATVYLSLAGAAQRAGEWKRALRLSCRAFQLSPRRAIRIAIRKALAP